MAKLMTTHDVALLKRCSAQTVINAVQRGALNGRKLGPMWVIDEDDTLADWNVKETGGRSHKGFRQSPLDDSPAAATPKD